MNKNGQMSAPSFLNEDAARKKKWGYLTEGLKDFDRLMLEAMLENTADWAAFEASNTGNVVNFTTYAFPLIRRIFPNLIANELVSVQPMTMPTGMLFFMDFLYGTQLRSTQVNDNVADLSKFNPYYAGGRVLNAVIGEGDGTEDEFTVTNAQYLPIMAGSATVFVDGVEVGATLAGAKFTLEAAPTDGAVVTASFTVATPTEGGDNIAELGFDMSSTPITAETKKLKAKWTLESQQDLFAYHGVNAETEMLGVLGDEIRREVDRLIVNDLYACAAAGNVNWSRAMPDTYEGSEREYAMSIFDAILDANNLIYKRRFRNATFIVADPDSCTRLEKLDGFAEIKDGIVGDAGMGLEKFGVLRNRFTVYKDPLAPANKMLIGRRGTSMFETGYVYAPYIPLYVGDPFTDPNTLVRVRSVMSRYARKPVLPDMYATITLI